MPKIEILAPVGSEEMLRAAVFSGADAVYLGFSGFNARTGAGNFDADSLKEAVRFCHARGVKVHVALNTTVYGGELAALAAAVKAVAESVGNAFEQVLMKNERNTVDMMKEVMNQFGTLGTAMTGSGPAVFGIFDNELYARVASETLRQRLKGNPEIVETEPMLSK